MTEQAAKLTVKVKLHAAQPVVLPTKAPPARLSKLKVFLGVLLLMLLTAAGYFLWQQVIGKVPQAVAADHQPLPDFSETVTEDTDINADEAEPEQPLPTEQSLASSPPEEALEVAQDVVADKATTEPAAALTVAESATHLQNPVKAAIPQSARHLPEGFSRIVLAATMEQLEPGAPIDRLVAQQHIQRLYLFTELKGYAGQQLIHRWSFAGQVQTEALLTIEDSPWRTYSEQWLLPDQLGSWRVEIVDQQQNVLYQHDFQYQ